MRSSTYIKGKIVNQAQHSGAAPKKVSRPLQEFLENAYCDASCGSGSAQFVDEEIEDIKAKLFNSSRASPFGAGSNNYEEP
jgi:hypothetical protein